MKNFFYRVSSGDTVFSLSQRFSAPISKIIKDNGLVSEISEGDILYIESVQCQTYKVCPYDTITHISKQFNVPEREILDYNSVDYVFCGLILFIPKSF